MGWGNESLITGSRSHDQDGHHAPMVKSSKNHLLWNQNADDFENLYAALGTQVLPSLFK